MTRQRILRAAALPTVIVLAIVTSVWRYSLPAETQPTLVSTEVKHDASPMRQYSDARLKTGVEDIHYGIDDVLRLHPVSFRFKSWPNEPRMGLIAQEVVDVVPEIVSLDPVDPEVEKERYYRVDYGQLIPLLVRSIQEQQVMIDSQKAQIAALESEVAGLNEVTGLSASAGQPGL